MIKHSFHMFSTHGENLRFLSDFQLIPWFSGPKHSPWFSHRFKGTPRPPGFPELLCGLWTHWSLGGGTQPDIQWIQSFLNLDDKFHDYIWWFYIWCFMIRTILPFLITSGSVVIPETWTLRKKCTPYLVTCWWNRHPLTLCTFFAEVMDFMQSSFVHGSTVSEVRIACRWKRYSQRIMCRCMSMYVEHIHIYIYIHIYII